MSFWTRFGEYESHRFSDHTKFSLIHLTALVGTLTASSQNIIRLPMSAVSAFKKLTNIRQSVDTFYEELATEKPDVNQESGRFAHE